MARVYGQIGPLKQIRNELDARGVDRFDSLREFDAFLENYESERAAIYQHFEKEVDIDILALEEDIKFNSAFIENTRKESGVVLEEKIKEYLLSVEKYRRGNENSFLGKIVAWFIDVKIKGIEKAHNKSINQTIKRKEKQVKVDQELLDKYTANRKIEIENRSNEKIARLEIMRDVVVGLKPLIAGAIGENLVVKEIQNLSDDYILINDFSMSFNPPIYNRKNDDRIFSIQIDHLLISKAGVFILETKNWSRESIQSLDMRSPIEQIRRSSFALFVLLNSDGSDSKIKLGNHHWGERSIPIRNVVVMINGKPDGEFMHVKVKTLGELNGYISFFKPVFSDEEFERISRAIIDLYYRNNRK